MRHKYYLFRVTIFLILITSIFSGCSSKKQENSDEKIISVSILPQKYFLEQICSDLFKINVIIPPGASPASYELTPGQVKELSHSALYFQIGHIGFEKSWMKRIAGSNKNMKIIDTSKGVELIAGEEFVHGDHVHLHGIDPHVWMSVIEIKQVSKNMLQSLSENFPQHKAVFEKNYAKWEKTLDELHNEIKGKLQGKEQKNFLIFHPALTYFARDYGLTQHALELEGKDPTPQHMANIVNIAKKDDIHVVFIQKEFDSDQAQTLANEITGSVIQIDPLAYNWPDQIKNITSKLDKALK